MGASTKQITGDNKMTINNSKTSRSRNLDDKLTAKEQLKKHPKAFALCTMTIEYLVLTPL